MCSAEACPLCSIIKLSGNEKNRKKKKSKRKKTHSIFWCTFFMTIVMLCLMIQKRKKKITQENEKGKQYRDHYNAMKVEKIDVFFDIVCGIRKFLF